MIKVQIDKKFKDLEGSYSFELYAEAEGGRKHQAQVGGNNVFTLHVKTP